MDKELIEKIDKIDEKLYNINRTISAMFVTGIRKPTQKDMMNINEALAQIIKDVRVLKQEKEEREFLQLNHDEMKTLKELLDIKESKCCYCKEKIKGKDNFSIFNKPTRLVCNSPLCLVEAMNEDE
jgi:hypothetical protein